MKSMTCRDMGGSCDTQIHAETWEDMKKNGGDHVKQVAEGGDESHKNLWDKMQNSSPEDMEKWEQGTKPKWDAAPDA